MTLTEWRDAEEQLRQKVESMRKLSVYQMSDGENSLAAP